MNFLIFKINFPQKQPRVKKNYFTSLTYFCTKKSSSPYYITILRTIFLYNICTINRIYLSIVVIKNNKQ